MKDFPDKVDRLLTYITKVYFPDKEVLEMIALEKMSQKVRQQGMTAQQLEDALLGYSDASLHAELTARGLKRK